MMRDCHELTRQVCEEATAIELDLILSGCRIVQEACTQGATEMPDAEERASSMTIEALESVILLRSHLDGK